MFDKARLAAILESEGFSKKSVLRHEYQRFNRKDALRIQALMDRAFSKYPHEGGTLRGSAAERHMLAAAERMARSIKDWKKAARRGSAAENENLHSVAKVFFDRADALHAQEYASGPDPRRASGPDPRRVALEHGGKTAAYPWWDAEDEQVVLRGWTEVDHEWADEAPAYLRNGELIIMDIMGFDERIYLLLDHDIRSVRDAEKIVEKAMKAARGNTSRLSDDWEEQ